MNDTLNPEKGFDLLAREYVEASENVDMYDLHSEIPEEMVEWNKLLDKQNQAKRNVFDYVIDRLNKYKHGEIEDFYNTPDFSSEKDKENGNSDNL